MQYCRNSEKGVKRRDGCGSLLKVLEEVLCRNGEELVVYGHNSGQTTAAHLPVDEGVQEFGRAVLEAAAVNGSLVHTAGGQEVVQYYFSLTQGISWTIKQHVGGNPPVPCTTE